MVVEFSKQFLKELKKYTSKQEAKALILKLAKTSHSEGDFVALMVHIVIREKRLKYFRDYFVVENTKKHVVSKNDLDEMLLKRIAMSKKNNPQAVIDSLKGDLQRFEFQF